MITIEIDEKKLNNKYISHYSIIKKRDGIFLTAIPKSNTIENDMVIKNINKKRLDEISHFEIRKRKDNYVLVEVPKAVIIKEILGNKT